MGNMSGFLYSPRIVFTAAHGKEDLEKPVSVGVPGAAKTGPKVMSIKAFWPQNYKDRTAYEISRQNDFEVIVLEHPLKMKNTVKVATEEEIKNFIANKTPINLVGYGLQEDRRFPSKNVGKAFYPKLLVSRMLNEAESNEIKSGLPFVAEQNYRVKLSSDVYFEQRPGNASVCDGDSGAGWFVENGKERIYIAAGSSGWGFPNCGSDGKWWPTGAVASASAAYKYLDLIKQAEDFAKTAPIITRCIKGIDFKAVKGLVCPKGFKEIKYY
jgi:hypothetical protein